MLIIVTCFVMEKKSLNLKPTIKMFNFLTQFCLRSISNRFSATESREASLNENVYGFSVDYHSIDKSHILNTQKYVMTKYNKNNVQSY